jgi:hypothetical protein
LALNALLAISPVVSPFTRPLTVNPLIVFVIPSKLLEPERPVTVALALFILAVVLAVVLLRE